MSAGLFDRGAAGQRSGGIWDYVSASRLNMWLKCPLAFKLKYIDGVREPATPALFVGKAVHASLECYYRHRQLGIRLEQSDLARRLVESWGESVAVEQVQFASSADEEAARRQALGLVTAYLATVPADEPRPLAVEVLAEAPLIDPGSGENLGMPVVGVMDLVLDEDAGPLIADFKTAAKSSEPAEITHEIQLSCYSYLFRRSSPLPECGLEIRSLIKTKVPQVQFHRYAARDARHFQRLFTVIRAYLDDLDAGRFAYRPTWTCASCEFRDTHCRSWAG